MSGEVKLSDFIEIEKKYGLYDDMIEGINYWVYSRFSIWSNIRTKQLNLGIPHHSQKMSLIQKVITAGELLKNFMYKGGDLKKDVDICFLNHPRRVKAGEFYECIYTDQLAKQYENYLVLEHPYQFGHLKPVLTKNLFYSDDIAIKGNLYYIFYKKIYKKKYHELQEQIYKKIDEPLSEIELKCDIVIDKGEITNIIAEHILICKEKYKCYERLINKINPKLVVEVVSYNMDCMIVNEICRKKRIVTIELQHGTMNEHIPYQYAADSEIKQFPQKIFVFSQYWKECIKVPISSEHIIVTGFPHFEKKVGELENKKLYNDEKINILFISQGTIGKELTKLAVELAKKIDENKYRILYKLHPGEIPVWKELYPELKNSTIEVLDTDKYSLYDYFAVSKIQIGVYSTALYEGLGFGLKTYIYRTGYASMMQRLSDMGYVSFVDNAEMLAHEIYRQENCDLSGAEFWESNALENMQNEINKCLKMKKEEKAINGIRE